MRRPLAAFATVACLQHFEAVLAELLEALLEAGLHRTLGSLSLAVLGAPEDRRRALAVASGFPGLRVVHESGDLSEYEYPALEALQAHCARGDGAVLYFHTKGVSHGPADQYAKHWRRLMTHHVVERHAECLAALARHDCAGTNWRDTHFSGNFWWANASYVRRLPPIGRLRHAPLPLAADARWNDRLQCEFWIGLGRPCRHANLGPEGLVLYDRLAWCTSRTQVLNALAERHGLSRYLEIGLHEASHNFDGVRAGLKHSVDPLAPATFRLRSDDFFGLLRPDHRYDLIFIDGLHEEAQARRDLANALRHLEPGGVVVLHDSSPPTRWHQRPPGEFQPGTEWNGTVWRAVVGFRLEHPAVRVYTVDTDWGCTVIRPSEQESRPLRGVRPEDLSWERFEQERDAWLNLVSVAEFRRRLGR